MLRTYGRVLGGTCSTPRTPFCGSRGLRMPLRGVLRRISQSGLQSYPAVRSATLQKNVSGQTWECVAALARSGEPEEQRRPPGLRNLAAELHRHLAEVADLARAPSTGREEMKPVLWEEPKRCVSHVALPGQHVRLQQRREVV